MKQLSTNKSQEEYLRILGKGMVTIPKEWRVELGLDEGDVVKAKKEGSKVVIETTESQNAPYRIFSEKEIEKWLKEDEIPISLVRKAEKKIKVYSMGKAKDDLRRVRIYDNI